MTPSVATSTTVISAALLADVSTAVHDREWWAEEAVHAGTDWYGVVTAALEMLVTADILELQEPESLTSWGAPSWREAAVEYHRDRPGRLAVRIEPRRLERLRRLLAVDVSLDRAWHELRDNRQGKFSNGEMSHDG
jgi:hypothetical protein